MPRGPGFGLSDFPVMNTELYVITDETIAGGRSHARIAQCAVAGGADVIQLRDKTCSIKKLLRTARELRAITRRSGTVLIINDRLDVALASGADGVHLGQGDIRVSTARQLSPPGFIIGVSVGTAAEAVEAEKEGADYLALSPTFSTTSKDDAGPGHGLDRLREVRQAVTLPLLAIGGIGSRNVREVIAAGADGIAVISAVVAAPDITAAARELKDLVRECRAGERR
jgi:thiamine-phosphate pyrophosphorylase